MENVEPVVRVRAKKTKKSVHRGVRITPEDDAVIASRASAIGLDYVDYMRLTLIGVSAVTELPSWLNARDALSSIYKLQHALSPILINIGSSDLACSEAAENSELCILLAHTSKELEAAREVLEFLIKGR